MQEVQEMAIAKIQDEFNKFKGGSKETAVSSYVSNVLQDFIKQDDRFADVILNYKRTLTDCLKSIMKGVGKSISDIDVYRKAVQFYFPNSEIEMQMNIHITGDGPSIEEINKEADVEKTDKTKVEAKNSVCEKPKEDKRTKSKPKQKQKDNFIQLTF